MGLLMSTYTRPIGTPSSSGGKSVGGKKRLILLAGGGVGLLAVFYVMRRNSVSSTASDITGDTSTDTSGDSSLDTGYSPALTSYTDPSTGATISGGGWQSGVGSLPNNTITAPSTNAQWAQQAIAYLTQQGFDPIAVSVALGKYLASQNLGDTELGIVQAAIAAEGQPPTPVSPPHVAPPSGQNGTGGGGTVTTPVTTGS